MQHLLHELIPFVSQYGLWVVFFGMMVEGTTMILVTGILCYLGMLSYEEAIPVAMLGAIIGDQFWYFMGRHYAALWIDKFPRFKEKVEKLKPTVHEKGNWFAFGSRFVYGGAILFPLTLGTYHYAHKKFTLFDTLGVSLWSVGGVGLGYLLGSSAQQFIGKIERVWHLLLLLAVGALLVWLVKFYMQGNKDKRTFK